MSGSGWSLLKRLSFAMVGAYFVYSTGTTFKFWESVPLLWSIAYAAVTVSIMGLSTWMVVKHTPVEKSE